MKLIPKNIFYFFLTLLFFWAIGLIIWAIYGYEESFLMLNKHYFALGDAIFPHLTHLGDGILLAGILAFVITGKDNTGLFIMIMALLIGMVVMYVLKIGFFDHCFRPPVVFGKENIHYITLQGEVNNSFPSGHSLSATVVCTYMAFFAGKKQPLYGIIIALFALLLCYTRLYIGVHFLGDIVTGSMIGFGIAILPLYFFYETLTAKYNNISIEMNRYISLVLWIAAMLIVGLDVLRLLRE